MRTETVIFVAMLLAVVLAGVIGYQSGYAEGGDDTRTTWTALTDRCIAKAKNLEILASGASAQAGLRQRPTGDKP